MSRANPFNPAAFQAQNESVDSQTTKKQKKVAPYKLTDNSSRDQVRKMLWEIFSQASSAPGQAQSGQDSVDDKDVKHPPEELVAMLEEQVFSMSHEDAKTREYRDRCNKLQMKLKGPRFAQVRSDLKKGTLTAEYVCSDEYLNSKGSAQQSAGAASQRGGLAAARGRGMMGATPRGRGMPPGFPGRGRGGMPPMGRPQVPQVRAPVEQAQNQEKEGEKTEVEPVEKEAEKQKEEPASAPEANDEKTEEKPEQNTAEERAPSEDQPNSARQPNAAQFQPPRPPGPMGRGKPPTRGLPPGRGRGGPNLRGGLPNQRAAPAMRSSPLVRKESDSSVNKQDDVQPTEPPAEIKEPMESQRSAAPLDDTQEQNSIETSKIELEFPNTSNLLIDESQSKIEKPSSERDDTSEKQEAASQDKSSTQEKQRSDSQNEDSSSQTASNKMPQFEASMDDSSVADPNNTSISMPRKKKKVKKVKKIKKMIGKDQSLDISLRQEAELKNQIDSSFLNEIKRDDNSDNKPKEERSPDNVDLPLQTKMKPVELTPNEVDNMIKDKREGKAQIGLLTEKNLQEQIDKKFPGQNIERDIDIESVMLDQTTLSPRAANQKETPTAQEIVQQVANQLEMMPSNENGSGLKASIADQGVQNNNNTVKSKSLSQSQMGMHDSDTRRLQDTLQAKKELINELNQKLQGSHSDLQIMQRKFKLVQDENQKLKDELSQQKNNFRQNEEKVFTLNQQLVQKEQQNYRIQKEKDDLVSQLLSEINTLKQDRDLYQDRYQKLIRDSMSERQNMEKRMQASSMNNSSDIINLIKSIQTFQSEPNQIDSSSQNPASSLEAQVTDRRNQIANNELGQPKADFNSASQQQNSASNYQEINLQKEINELKEQYEQKLREQKKQLDGVTRDLHKVQRQNDNYKENNRKLTDAVQNIERGNISVMAAGSGAQNTTTDIFYQQMMDNISQEDIDDDDTTQNNGMVGATQNQIHDFNNTGQVNQAASSSHETNRQGIVGEPITDQSKISNQQNQNNQFQSSQTQQDQNSGEHGSQGMIRGNQRQNYGRNIHHGQQFFENQDEATGGESHHGFQNTSSANMDDQLTQIADQQSALAQDPNTINDQSMQEHFQNNHQSSALNTHQQNSDSQVNSQANTLFNMDQLQNHSGSALQNIQSNEEIQTNSGSVSAVQQVSISNNKQGQKQNMQDIFDGNEQQQQNQSQQFNNPQSQQHAGSRDDNQSEEQQPGMQQTSNVDQDPGQDDGNKSDSDITEEDEIEDESRDESRDDDFRDSQADSGLDDDELDDDDSEESGGSNDDTQNDMNQIGIDHQTELTSNALQGTIGGAGGAHKDRAASDVGGLSSQNQHIGPGAIPSQNFPQGANNQTRNSRQTGSGVRFGAHGNMPHQFQQNSQQQYGSSGASGHSNRGVGQIQQHSLNQQNDDQNKNSSAYFNQNHQTASASGATGSGVSSTNQRRNRRGNRQQNQQPSSGANGGENVAVRRSNRQNNNRQGRQTLDTAASGGGGSSQMTIQNRSGNDVGAAHRHIHSGNQSSQRQNELNVNPNSQDQQQYAQTNNQDQRGRSQRTYNRGRQQRNNQQQQQIGQNAAAPTQQSNSSQMQQQHAPVSLSQEREQQAQNQNYNRYMSASLGSGSGSAQEMQFSQSAAQAQLRRGQPENQAVQQVIQMNAPASTQSHYSRGNHQQQNHQNRQLPVQSSAIQGAASQHMNSQSSQMIPASTASHSGGTQNPFGRNFNEGSNNQQTTGAPHGGGGTQRQISGSRGVAHATVSFESGSTSFMDRQANSGLAASEQSQNYNNAQSNRQHHYPRPNNTYTQISQVSSPPSNNINLVGMQPRNQSNQQNEFPQNTPNSDMSGPGAVGAPPSSQQISAAQTSMRSQYNNSNMPSSSGINESTQMLQMAAQQPHQQQQNISPGSSQPGGTQNSSMQNQAPGQGGHQGQHINRMHRASVPENMRQHNREMEEEKQSSHGTQQISQQQQQQSIMTIPSSLFGSNHSNNTSMNLGAPKHQTPAALQMVGIGNDGMDASSGTGTAIQMNYNTSSNLFNSGYEDGQPNSMMNFINSGQVDQQNHEQRATPPRHNNDSRKTSGANTPSKDGANTPTTHQSQSQQYQQNLQNRAQMLNNIGTTSSAGVNAGNNIGASQGQLPSGHSASEFGSAVTAGLNNHLNNLGQGGQQQVHPGSTGNGAGMASQIGSNNQNNYVHDLTNSQLFGSSQNESNSMPDRAQANANASASGGPNSDGRNVAGGGPNSQNVGNSGGAGMSIIDQLSQSVTQNRNSDVDASQAASMTTASLFDDFLNNIPDGAQKM